MDLPPYEATVQTQLSVLHAAFAAMILTMGVDKDRLGAHFDVILNGLIAAAPERNRPNLVTFGGHMRSIIASEPARPAPPGP